LLKASSQQHHLILLDVMLPKRDGFSLLKVLRESSQTPIIMVTAKNTEQERTQGFSQQLTLLKWDVSDIKPNLNHTS
jgi:two-component system response regulator PfeR